MGRCEKWAIIWSHFGDTQYGVKNEENMWTKSNKTRQSFLGQQNMEKKCWNYSVWCRFSCRFLFSLVAPAQEYGQTSKYRRGLAVLVS